MDIRLDFSNLRDSRKLLISSLMSIKTIFPSPIDDFLEVALSQLVLRYRRMRQLGSLKTGFAESLLISAIVTLSYCFRVCCVFVFLVPYQNGIQTVIYQLSCVL